jgi:CheY-like chemotaxis protein
VDLGKSPDKVIGNVGEERPTLSLLLLGDTDRHEFGAARSCLDRWGDVQAFRDVAAAAEAMAAGQVVPDVIVVAEAFPGQFSHRAVDQLRRQSPFARVIGLMGSWCEGEMRTGTPWPGVARTYWHQWAARCDRELRRLAEGQNCAWMLPPTATEEERLLADLTHPWPPRRGLVVIRARSHEMTEWLSAACRSRGYATVWQRAAAAARVEGATAALFDTAELNENENGELRRMVATLDPAPVIVLLSFPRADDSKRALSAGAAAVVSKPLAVDDLFEAMETVVRG